LLFADKDIYFEEDPEFSARYRLNGQDGAALRSLFGPDVRARFTRSEKKWAVGGQEGRAILLYTDDADDGRVKPEDVANYLADAWTLFEVIRSVHPHD